MPDRRDDLDSWLDGRIDPLPPPPGTFELIKKRARRRKYRRVAVGAGVAAVIVAAAVAVPQVVNLPAANPPAAAPAANGRSATPTPSASRGASTASSAASSVVPKAAGPVPGNFRPSSVTFIGTQTGWVIGQAGTPGHCATAYCTSVASTDDAGKTWSGVPAPPTGPADGAAGVSRVRFLDERDGWAFGPQLYATHDGGHTWTQVVTNGLRVTGLGTVGSRAFALFASCTGTGPAFAARCTSYTLYSSSASADDWTPVGPATSALPGGAALMVLTGTRGYLLAPNGMLYSGPVNGSAPEGCPSACGVPTGHAGEIEFTSFHGPLPSTGPAYSAPLGASRKPRLLVSVSEAASSAAPLVSPVVAAPTGVQAPPAAGAE